MKISNIKKNCLLLFILALGHFASAQNTDSLAAVKKADKWVKSRVWAKDVKLKLHSSTNSVEFERQYESNKELWDKVFAFLADSKKLNELAPGKYPIDGENAYASITLGPPKKLEDAKWESHRKYIDLQYVISGKIQLGLAPLSIAQVIVPYDAGRDGANYTAEGKYFEATPKNFFLFFPNDVHRPDIKVDGYDIIKKLVIKIRYQQ